MIGRLALAAALGLALAACDGPKPPTPAPEPSAPAPKTSAVEDALKTIEPDALTPKQALEVLYELKRKLPS